MRGISISRKWGLFALLLVFAWLFFVLVILPRRRQAADAVDDANAGEQEPTPIAELTLAVEEPRPIAGEDLVHEISRVLGRRDNTPSRSDPADSGNSTFALLDTRAAGLVTNPDVPEQRPSVHATEGPQQILDEEDLLDDAPRVLERWDSAQPDPISQTTPALVPVPASPVEELDVQPDFPVGRNVRSAFERHDGGWHPSQEHERATGDPVLLDRSPDVLDPELHQSLEALAARSSEIDSSLDRAQATRLRAAPERALGVDEPHFGLSMCVRALWRFRWLILVAVCASILVPLFMLYRPLWPPGLESRATVSYVTRTQLLVDSPSRPFVRTETMSYGRSVQPVSPDSGPSDQTASSPPSDTGSLVGSANLFPLLMESDEIVALRRKLLGNTPGTIHATALFALQDANRFRPSVLPVMQIIAVAPDPKSALRLGPATVRAFKIWLAREQTRAKVPPGERIVVRQLRQPHTPQKTGGPSYALPLVAGLALLGAFVALAVAIDRALTPAVTRQSAEDGMQAELERAHASTHEFPYGRDYAVSEMEEASARSQSG